LHAVTILGNEIGLDRDPLHAMPTASPRGLVVIDPCTECNARRLAGFPMPDMVTPCKRAGGPSVDSGR